MKASSRNIRPLLLVLAATLGVLVTFTVVRAQSGTTKKVIPNLPLAPLSSVATPPVPGLSNYVANTQAAIALGKALFWDMQAGSDGVQSCATCHFNAGADSRAMNQVSPGLKSGDITFRLGVVIGSNTYPNYHLHAGTSSAGFGGYHDGDFPLHKVANPDQRSNDAFPTGLISDTNDVISSQGVYSSSFDNIVVGSGVDAYTITTDQAGFSYPNPANSTARIDTRRVEPRNTPSAVNAVFNYRNFWDGRAQNTCNGANPFGERDTTSHFFMASTTAVQPTSALIRLQNSALCSQALGPPMSPFEMSAAGRTFRKLGQKLLAVSPLQTQGATTPLGQQAVDPQDSVLGKNSKSPKKGMNTTYQQMVQNAFQPTWWQSRWHVCVDSTTAAEKMIDPTAGQTCPAGSDEYTQAQYNFSLFWGIAIQLYESTLRADQTPLDKYLSQQLLYSIPANNVTNSFSFMLKSSPITPYTVSVQAFNPNLDASDQDVFAFDDGAGNIVGAGITSGSINYTTGQVTLLFDLPPNTAFPTKVAYSSGTAPLTSAQLHGLQIFQTKGRCIVCHGGPELTNASVTNVSQRPLERMIMGDTNIRVYDDGFYHIGVRKGSEDIGLGDVDGAAGLPLSMARKVQQDVCNGGTAPTLPGRPGDGISAAPLSCGDTIADYGDMKTPGLRNVSLTAPYFHNGGQLTLEQVVEFYNRGGDFPDGFSEIPLMDPNIQPLGLTGQEKTDLVDFLRNGLLDSRTLNQQAPFDHPSLLVPNGHPVDANGYPVPDPSNPSKATDQYILIPANGKNGGTPLPTFLDNMIKP